MNSSTTLEMALEAMNVLNGWARSRDCAPRRAIYWLKARYAIRDAVISGMVTKLRAIQVTTKCNRCRDGIYMDWDGFPRGTCYTCNGSSKVTLKFAETTIADRWTWHSPLHCSSWLGWPMDDLPFEEAQDWTVNQPGRNLDVEEAVRNLNIVEEFWPQWRKHSPYEIGREEWDSHRYYIFNYSINVGRGEGVCVFCKRGPTTGHHHTRLPGLTYIFQVCEGCSGAEKVWDQLALVPLPPLSSEIEKWVTRHTFDFEASWNRPRWVDNWDGRKTHDAMSAK